MSLYFCVSVTFLDPEPAFHGRGAGDSPEWPPSPLRVFQALVAASAARWRYPQFAEYAMPALRWLEAQDPPFMVAPQNHAGVSMRIAVPNNDMDIPAAFWARRVEPPENKTPQRLKTMKTVRPTWLLNGDAVHYLWGLPDPLTDDIRGHVATLSAAAGSMVALGWGVDLVAARGHVLPGAEAGRLPGEHWRPSAATTSGGLRIPIAGTLDALVSRHDAFLHRLDGGGFTPVPPPTAFSVIGYRRATDPPVRPFAAFAILQPDASGFRPFDTPSWAVAVAGMVRCAVATLAAQTRPFGWTDEDINTFVHGHTPDGTDCRRGDGADQRFAYLPLPTINPMRVEMIRRVLVVGPPGGNREIEWLRRALVGRELVAKGRADPVGLLSLIPANDKVVRAYTQPAAVWSTVTPVVLPGHGDSKGARHKLKTVRDPETKKRLLLRLDQRTEEVLRRAFEHAGLPPELVQAAGLEWRRAGFLPGVDLAERYRLPDSPERRPTYHVRVRFPVPISGPLAVGAARYRGLGVFAAEGSE